MREPLNNRPELEARRRELRGSLTVAEARLWSCLQRSRLGWKFRRQHSIGPFIVDFYCPSARLAIELDGAGHDSAPASLAVLPPLLEELAARGLKCVSLPQACSPS